MRDWIEKKKNGEALADDEIRAFVRGATDGSVPDYQTAALLMAICLRGMRAEETAALTEAMIASGRVLDWDGAPAHRVDKHSTGGVGDKISLVLAPAVAACGAAVPMISGRSLGHTGGTLDKLESIPGMRTALSLGELQAQVVDLGLAFGAATEDLAPADRKLYRLRDATGTVASIPLITSSILSKKVAEGLTGLVLDVKTGRGAFLPERDVARQLALNLVNTADRLGVEAVALLTDMSRPLGRAVGNALEVEEALACLRGGGPDDVVGLTIELGAEMLRLARVVTGAEEGRRRVARALSDGSALEKFRRVVERQGGDVAALDGGKLPRARHVNALAAREDGFVRAIDARVLGEAATALGAGRQTMAEAVRPGVGLVLQKDAGDAVRAGDVLVEVHHDDAGTFAAWKARIQDAFTIGERRPPTLPLVLERVAGGRWKA